MTDWRWNWVKDVWELISRINPVLCGWGNYFRTGNAVIWFNQIDTYTYECLRRFMVKWKGRNLRAGESGEWNREFFWNLGLHRLRGIVQYLGGV